MKYYLYFVIYATDVFSLRMILQESKHIGVLKS